MNTIEKTEHIINNAFDKTLLLDNSDIHGLVKQHWKSAINNHNLPIYTYTQILLQSGVDKIILNNLFELLIGLGIDVSDPYSSSSELSVIIGYMSKDLLGFDLSHMRRTVDEVMIKNKIIYLIQKTPFLKPPTSDNYLRIYQHIKKIQKNERELILSNEQFSIISKTILETNDSVIKALLSREIPKIWKRLKVSKDSNATIYFRSLKAYAGDVDFYYWGPQSEKVIKQLSQYLMPLGYKIDHCSTTLIDSIIKNKYGVDNAFLGGYLYVYFFMGKYLEFNGGKFADFYTKNVLPAVSLEVAWPPVYDWIMRNLDIMENVYLHEAKEYPGFKDLSFRTLEGILMGLSLEFDIPHFLDFEEFIEKLKLFLNTEEIKLILDVFYYTNHIRNVYQQLTERRWEMIYPETLYELNKVITKQGCEKIEQKMNMFAKRLKQIVLRYISIPENISTVKRFEEYKSEAPVSLKNSYNEVAKLYKSLVRDSVNYFK